MDVNRSILEKGRQVKRLVSFAVAVAVLVGLAAAPASAAIPAPIAPVTVIPVPEFCCPGPPPDCRFSIAYPSWPNNGMAWSTSDMESFHTPTMRAGACGKVWVESLGVYDAPACMNVKLVTYHEDGRRNYVGPWYQLRAVGDDV